MPGQPQSSIDLTQSDDEDDEVTDLTLPESDDDIFAGPATHQVQAHKKAAAKKTDVTDLTRSSDDEDPAAAEAERKPAAAASYGADSEAQQQPSIFAQGVLVIHGSTRCHVTNSHSLASAQGQRILTAAPRQGAAGGAPGGAQGGAAGCAARVGGMKVILSGDAAASPATESDDEAPIPASTSPQAVASCARMRVEPIDNSASSEKPGKALCKGKQKAADGIGGSALELKPNARSAAKPTETEPRAGTTAAKKQKKRKWHATVKDRRWISDVEAWFAEKQREFKWLNIDELEAATVDLMIQMESDEIRACMADCLKKRAVELNMHVFNKVLQGGLK